VTSSAARRSESGVPREEVFITTKFYPAREDPVAEAERSLQPLGVDHVDLYIIHWPEGGRRGRGPEWSELVPYSLGLPAGTSAADAGRRDWAGDRTAARG